jgi:hypothetical protein
MIHVKFYESQSLEVLRKLLLLCPRPCHFTMYRNFIICLAKLSQIQVFFLFAILTYMNQLKLDIFKAQTIFTTSICNSFICFFLRLTHLYFNSVMNISICTTRKSLDGKQKRTVRLVVKVPLQIQLPVSNL